MSDLDELERLERAATPVPWTAADDSTTVRDRHDQVLVEAHAHTGYLEGEADVELIVALRNAAPALVAAAREVERLRALQQHTLRRVELEQERGKRLHGALRDLVGAWISKDEERRIKALKSAIDVLIADDVETLQSVDWPSGVDND